MTENWICKACHGQNPPDAEICICGEGARDEREFPTEPLARDMNDEPSVGGAIVTLMVLMLGVLGAFYVIACKVFE